MREEGMLSGQPDGAKPAAGESCLSCLHATGVSLFQYSTCQQIRKRHGCEYHDALLSTCRLPYVGLLL